MHLGKFVHTKSGKVLMSVILGFGLASLFRVVCKDKNCIISRAPPMDKIEGKIYKYQDKCYSYNPTSVKCDANKNDVTME